MGWVYGAQCGAFIKIGATSHLQRRIVALQSANPFKLKIVIRRQVLEYFWVEKRVHEILAPVSIGGEWFEVVPELAREAVDIAMRDVVDYRYKEAARLRGYAENREAARRAADVR